MDLFKLSDNILSMICKNAEKPFIQYEIYPFSSHGEMSKDQGSYLHKIESEILDFYKMNLEQNKKRVSLWKILYPNNEAFKNWVDHAPEKADLMTGLFLGDKGVCYSFFDGGIFFRDDKIKNQLENKIPFAKFDEAPRGKTSHRGFSYIYKFSDAIEVDSKKGILYVVQLKKNIIAPEGEDGNEYFYNLEKW